MRYVIALTVATALAALSSVVCSYFANNAAKGIGTGFLQGELKIIPWIVFIITLVSISKGGTQARPTESQRKSEPTSQSPEEPGKPEAK